MTNEEKLAKLDGLTTAYLMHAREVGGVEESVVAILMPVEKGCELRVRVNGSSDGIVNMLSAIVQQLVPTDFAALLMAMQHSPVFGMHRDPTPIEKRHVN